MKRRQFLATTGLGACELALSSLVRADLSTRNTGQDFSPAATSVVFLFMAGGPSQVDTFDPKPDLEQLSGRDVPESIARTVPAIKRAGLNNLLASPWAFHRPTQ
jgi:hypothetical protein